MIELFFIMTHREYFEAGIDLWYSKVDQAVAQCQVAHEVKKLMDFNPSLKMEQAMSFLYQPRTDYVNSFVPLNQSVPRENLSVMIIDKEMISFQESSHCLSESLQQYNRWIISCTHAVSAEASLKIISNKSLNLNKVDVIIMDSNLHDSHDINYLSLLRMFRSICGGSVLLGVLFPTLSDIDEDFRIRAIKSGINFMWSKPISHFVEMLPSMLLSRDREKASVSAGDIYLSSSSPPAGKVENRIYS